MLKLSYKKQTIYHDGRKVSATLKSTCVFMSKAVEKSNSGKIMLERVL